MTAFDRFERGIPQLMDELASAAAFPTTSTTCSAGRRGRATSRLERPRKVASHGRDRPHATDPFDPDPTDRDPRTHRRRGGGRSRARSRLAAPTSDPVRAGPQRPGPLRGRLWRRPVLQPGERIHHQARAWAGPACRPAVHERRHQRSRYERERLPRPTACARCTSRMPTAPAPASSPGRRRPSTSPTGRRMATACSCFAKTTRMGRSPSSTPRPVPSSTMRPQPRHRAPSRRGRALNQLIVASERRRSIAWTTTARTSNAIVTADGLLDRAVLRVARRPVRSSIPPGRMAREGQASTSSTSTAGTVTGPRLRTRAWAYPHLYPRLLAGWPRASLLERYDGRRLSTDRRAARRRTSVGGVRPLATRR